MSESLFEELKSQLRSMSETEKEDAFYKNLEFVTGGMRGAVGSGTNRLNTYTVRKATTELACYIETQGEMSNSKW